MIIDLLAWGLLAAYAVHLLDESLMNGGFVDWVSASFWPGYNHQMFFWFNAGAVFAIVVSNALFDLFGRHFVILPLLWIFGFALHGATVHVFWTVRQRDYSPGLVTSLLYWILGYLVARYAYATGLISPADFWIGVVAGVVLVGGFLTFGPTVLFPAITRAEERSAALRS
jgi:hypothetical protein